MTIEQVKIKVVEDILKVKNEQMIFDIENMISLVINDHSESAKLTATELGDRIDKSELDILSGNVTHVDELLSKYS